MRPNLKSILLLNNSLFSPVVVVRRRRCNNITLPIFDFYNQTTEIYSRLLQRYECVHITISYPTNPTNIINAKVCKHISDHEIPLLKKKHPNLEKVDHDRLQCSLLILQKFGISPLEACNNLHVFSMNPITVDNYGEILKECGFINILPQYIIKYHTIAKASTIATLKEKGIMRQDIELEKALLDNFTDWPTKSKTLIGFPEQNSTILSIRTSVLERYLIWRLWITSEEFEKYCRNYLPLRHKPMADIRESLDLAQNEIKFDINTIQRNGFITAADPVNTKLILDNVETLAGVNIREAIRMEPAILKNNYISLLEVKSLLEEYRITEEFQRRCLRVYCMRPDTIKERLDELRNMKEYKVLSTNPRVLTLVVHKKKMMNRIEKIQTAKKQCYSLNHLISSNKVFNNYISGFGSKACGRDIGTLINSSLDIDREGAYKEILKQLRKHKYWLHVSLNTVDENIQLLKRYFKDDAIYNHTLLLLYPVSEVKRYMDIFLQIRRAKSQTDLDVIYQNLRCNTFTDDQILSLVLYEIEKRYHFSGDGIWSGHEGKIDGISAS